MQVENISERNLVIGLGVLSLVVVYMFLGFFGVRTIVGVLLFFTLPFYFILNNFKLDVLEKLFYAYFLGFACFGFVVYYVDRIIPSLKISILVSFLLLCGVGWWLRKK